MFQSVLQNLLELSATLSFETCPVPKKNKNNHVKDDYCQCTRDFNKGGCPCAAPIREHYMYNKLKHLPFIARFMSFSWQFMTGQLPKLQQVLGLTESCAVYSLLHVDTAKTTDKSVHVQLVNLRENAY